jgi:hypothetical protein
VDRVQAMSLLKEIACKIPELDPQAISIMEGEPNNSLQIGCSIHFKGLSADCVKKIELIGKNYSLAFLDNEIELAIYTPSRGVFTKATKIR